MNDEKQSFRRKKAHEALDRIIDQGSENHVSGESYLKIVFFKGGLRAVMQAQEYQIDLE